MSGIRVTYSGLISFFIGILSIITGLIFTLIVTRQLSQEEFGTWALMGTMISYVLFVEPVISYWTLREISRGENSGKTAIISSSLFSGGGIVVYLIIVLVIGSQINIDFNILIFAAVLIPVLFLNKTLNAINNAWKPHVTSYGLMAFEIAKIPSGFLLVYFLQMGLEGAIIATLIAYMASNTLLIVYAKEKIREKFKISVIKKWLKLFWLPLVPGISSIIFNLDIAIFSIITGSVEGIALFGVSSTITGIIMHSSSISKSVYPKLLGGGKKEYVQENLVRFLYFAIPLTALTIVFAKPGLFALNPIYEIAQWIVFFMAFKVFLTYFGNIFTNPLLGFEKVDTNKNSTFKDFIKSKLFIVPSIKFIYGILYLIIFTVVIFIMQNNKNSQLELVIVWVVIGLLTQIPLTIYYYNMSKKIVEISFRNGSIGKYLIVSLIIFGISYFVVENFLEYPESIFVFLPQLLLYVIGSVISYLAITYLIDSRTKILFKSIYNEFKR